MVIVVVVVMMMRNMSIYSFESAPFVVQPHAIPTPCDVEQSIPTLVGDTDMWW
jgi:hypothetical protein